MERFVTGSHAGLAAARRAARRLGRDRRSERGPRASTRRRRGRSGCLALDIETLGSTGRSSRSPSPRAASSGLDDRRRSRRDGRAPRGASPGIVAFDPDVIAGWSVVEFDLAILEQRCDEARRSLRDRPRRRARARPRRQSPPIARIAGRVVLDGPQTLRVGDLRVRELPPRRRRASTSSGAARRSPSGVDPVEEIRRMYREDPRRARRVQPRGLPPRARHPRRRRSPRLRDRAPALDRPAHGQGGRLGGRVRSPLSAALASRRLRRRSTSATGPSPRCRPGGAVLESEPGSLPQRARARLPLPVSEHHPHLEDRPARPRSCRATIGSKASTAPRSRARAPSCPSSSRRSGRRASSARTEGRAALSTAIKILMNSFYGVLGTPGCRFFDPRLAASITRRGHEVIGRTRAFVEERGMEGDLRRHRLALRARGGQTRAKTRRARSAAQWPTELNALAGAKPSAREHRLESHLELRFDTHFLHFFMPTLRNSDRGTKKRYAGSVRKPDGGDRGRHQGARGGAHRLDAARARGRSASSCAASSPTSRGRLGSLEVRADVLAGKLDDKLVYKKRLRRDLDAYAADRRGRARARARRAQARRRRARGVAT